MNASAVRRGEPGASVWGNRDREDPRLSRDDVEELTLLLRRAKLIAERVIDVSAFCGDPRLRAEAESFAQQVARFLGPAGE